MRLARNSTALLKLTRPARSVFARRPSIAPARAAEMFETVARHAVAHVERQDDVERDLLEADDVDGLGDAFVADVEVGRRQPSDGPAILRDEHVDADRLEPARKRRGLRCEENASTPSNAGHRRRGEP